MFFGNMVANLFKLIIASEMLTFCDTLQTLHISISGPIYHTLTKFIYRIALNKDYLSIIMKGLQN